MKNKEEIEQLANDYWEGCDGCDANDKYFFIKGFGCAYRQLQEDMSNKKYTEKDVRDAINVGIDVEAGFYPDGWNFKLGISLEDYFINSLNKTNDK